MSDLKREIIIKPAYDCIRVQPCHFGDGDCGGSHGIHNASMHFALSGTDTEVLFEVGTEWYLPETPEKPPARRGGIHGEVPKGYAVRFHSRSVQHDGQEPMHEECDRFGGDPCYSDVSFLTADEGARILVREGSEGVWRWMEDLYQQVFSGVPMRIGGNG